MPNWTSEQLDAITDRGHSLIVCAAAGSGKTAVLVERIVRLICEGCPVDRMLVVTFTNAAASEMHPRIGDALSRAAADNPALAEQLMALPRASISTLHRFCGNLLREHFHALGVDPAFRIADEQECGVLARQAMEDALYACYETADPDFIACDACYTQEEMTEIAGRIYAYMMTRPDPWAWLDRAAENLSAPAEALGESAAVQMLLQSARDQLALLRDEALATRALCRSEGGPMHYDAAIAEDVSLTDGLLDAAIRGYTSLAHELAHVSFAALGRKKKTDVFSEDIAEVVKARREALKKNIKILTEQFALPLDDAARDLLMTHAPLRGFAVLLRTYDALYSAARRQRNVMNFNDLEHLALRALGSEDVRRALCDQYRFVFVAEYQDSSAIQEAILGSFTREDGQFCVGDVKQSIYRWRSGDWRMLNNIKGEFPQVSDMLDIRTLTHNYRSSRRVINFNNAFFERAAEIEFNDLKECCGEDDMQLAEQLKSAYADVCQQVPDKREDSGYVHIELLPQDDYTDITLNKTVETVDHLIELGADPSDIAIIVRSNNTIQQIAEHFACVRPELKIVSDEAFRLDNSTALNILVAAMHSLTHQDDKLTRAYIAKAYLTKVKGVDLEAANRMVSTEEGVEEALPASYRDHSDELLVMPIYELAERLYKIFSLERIVGEDAYVYAFFDCLTSFLTSNTATLDDFVEEWNENFASNTIQARSIDGIRLITIHKSKGLEFKHVIIPFCDWRMEKTNTIWCEPTEAPFKELPLVPVDFNAKQMMGTIYERDYIVEHLQNCVDNLNLLYVAFTRAERSLIVFARRGNASLRSYVIEQAISDIQLPDCSLDGDLNTSPSHHLSGGALVSTAPTKLTTSGGALVSSAPTNLTTSPSQHITLTYGEIDTTKEKKKAEEPNIFTPHVENILLPMKTYASNVEFKQSNKSRDFINDEADDEQAEQQSYIKTGLLLHYLFSNIETANDVDSCLHDMEMEGLFDESVITPNKLKNMLHKRFSNPKVKEWFGGGWTLFNECSILSYDPHTDKLTEHRPDRVMKRGDEVQIVDFKFGKPQPEYTDQVRRYISLTHDMGYTDVKGYLWYVYSDNIVEV